MVAGFVPFSRHALEDRYKKDAHFCVPLEVKCSFDSIIKRYLSHQNQFFFWKQHLLLVFRPVVLKRSVTAHKGASCTSCRQFIQLIWSFDLFLSLGVSAITKIAHSGFHDKKGSDFDHTSFVKLYIESTKNCKIILWYQICTVEAA